MALIPKPRFPRAENLPVPAAPSLRPVAELEPERGYLSREMAEAPTVDGLTGEEDLLVFQRGKAAKSPIRYFVSLARTENQPQGNGRIGGGGGRHTYERSVMRSPLEAPEATDYMLAVRDGVAIRVTLSSVGQFAGDMLKAIYDTDNDATVDNSEQLGGQLPAYYLARANHTGTQTAATISDFAEALDDRAAALIQNGTGISWTYNDGLGTLTPAVSLTSFSTTNLSEGSNLYFTDERVDDRVAALVQNGTGITWSYNDAGGTLTPTIGSLTTAQFAANVVDTDVTLAANSNTRIASQAAVKAYADALIAANDAMVFKGVIDASANPNYPAADRGHVYKVSVAGKIGGVSGPNVEAGDQLLCTTDGTASGNHATVGANWSIIQVNIDGAVIGPASVTDDLPAIFDGATGKLIKSKTYAAFKTLLVLVKGDVGLGNVDNTSDTTKNAAAVALTNKDLTSGTNTFPTLNQNTTGSAAKLTTARTIDGQSFDGTANITVIAPGTHAATSKATPVDADEVPLVDTAASNVLKRLTWANLKATLKTYFDTLYRAVGTAISLTADVSGILPEANGGTGVATHYRGTFGRGGVSQSLTAGSEAKIQLTTADFNSGLTFDGVTNFRITVPVAGKYRISGQAYFGGVAAGDLIQCFAKKNGSSSGMPFATGGTASAFDQTMTFGAEIVSLAASDYIELFVNKATGANTTINGSSGNTWLSIEYVGS